MRQRSVRVVLLLLTVVITAGVVWRVTRNEQARGRDRLASQQMDATAADALFMLADLRAALHAYVAPGQGADFWATRAKSHIEAVRARLGEVEPAAAAANHPLTDALAAVDKLSVAERRAYAYVRAEQMLAAGDVIFSDLRDLIDLIAREVSSARQAMSRAGSAREGGMANEQSLIAGGLLSVWIFTLLLLVPLPPTSPVPSRTNLPAKPLVPSGSSLPLQQDPARASTREPELPAAPPPVAPVPAPLSSVPDLPAIEASATPIFQDLAALCLDLGRVSDAEELNPLLGRAARILDARGVVVWLLAEDRQGLVPAVAHGYDPQVLSRLGPLTLTADNLTAAAFRSASAATSSAAADYEAAVAVPILSATGPSGVFTAEVHASGDLERAAALASVIGAQLANLFPAPTVAEGPSEEPVHA